MKYRKKPVVVEAWQWDGSADYMLAPEWVNKVVVHWSSKQLHIPTLEGTMIAQPLDWLIKGIKGEVYPCKPDIFEATYEVADDTAPATVPEHIVEQVCSVVAKPAATCRWKYDEHHDYYDTDCGQGQCFSCDGVKENHYKFCPYCGKEIEVTK